MFNNISTFEGCMLLWAAAIAIFSIVEAMTAQLVSIWFVIGAIAALISTMCGASLIVQAIIFTAVTILTLLITRPLVKKYIRPKKEYTNADRVIGQTGVVIEEIDNLKAKGQVKADGKIWSARSDDSSIIETNAVVEITKIDGVKLIVTKKN